MIDWQIGSQIVCINDDPSEAPPGWLIIDNTLDGLTRGCVYTVAGFQETPWETVNVILAEIQRPQPPEVTFVQLGFSAIRFRPVKKTSINCFTKMLTNIPADLECV